MTTPTTSDLHALLDTDPAAGLRGVGALMRARAESASPGPWEATAGAFGDPSGGPDHMRVVAAGWSSAYDSENTVARMEYEQRGGNDAVHIASWHPAVALDVADLIEFAAPFANQPMPYAPTIDHAMKIARAYLGPRDARP